jgi:hypothetical protein
MVKRPETGTLLFHEGIQAFGNAGTQVKPAMPGKRTDMGNTTQLPTLDALKDQARRLRETLARQGTAINHARSLELIAGQHGFRDWNTLHAKIGNMPPKRGLALGDTARGRYLGKSFTGTVVALQQMGAGGMTRVTFDFAEPVNVSAFDSFKVLRKRVVATLGSDGRTIEKTSNGLPHLELA